MEKLLLLDGNNLMFRAFYALPVMETPDGRFTNAVYGFMGMLIRLMGDYKPDAVGVAFDLSGPTFRHEQYAEYKAGRKPTPQELRPQFPLLKDLLGKIGVAVLEAEGFEADDILGTLGSRAAEYGAQALLVSGDRDVFQLIGPNVTVLYANRGVSDIDALDDEKLQTRFGYAPSRVTDLKALMGDASDNIPGIPGVGEKTALNLINHFETLEDILARPEEVLKGAMLKKVQAGAESARFSKELATIRRDVPIEFSPNTLAAPDLRSQRTYDALAELEMPSLVERLKRSAPAMVAQQGAAAARGTWQPIKLLTTAQEAKAFLADLPGGPLALTLWPEIEIAAGAEHARLCLKLDLLSDGFEDGDAYALLKEALQGRDVYYCGRKASRAHLAARGIEAPPALGDALIAGYLLFTMEGAQTLSPLAEKVFGEPGEGAAVLYDLTQAMHERIAAEGMERLYREIELPLADVLYDMEREGFAVDTAALSALGEGYDKQLAGIREEIYALAGEAFNILSPKQLGEVLFVKLGLPPQKKTKAGFSTDSSVLEALDHPIAQKVLEYRALSKLKGTYIDGLLGVIGADGRVHTTFHQTLTATGRISSAEPNLQNIPVRTEQGREIRKAFVPGAAGNVLVDADYSQIELRVLAHMSGDPNMQEAYRLGQDIHRRTAAEIYGVPMEEVTPTMRSSAKAVNFGVVYGISDFGLARNTGISRTEARAFIDTYFERYPLVKRFMDSCVSTAKTEGYVTTLLGRRRYLPELSSSNYNTRSFGERAAMNTPIQGTAADIIKLAMVKVAGALRDGGFKARLILQVHDELIVDAPAQEAEAVEEILRLEMESAVSLSVPLEADVHVGDTWENAK